MIERHAIEDRGRQWGLVPRGGKIEIRSERREWQHVEAWELQPGDVWAYHGKVTKATLQEGLATISAGSPEESYEVAPDSIVYAFVRIQ